VSTLVTLEAHRGTFDRVRVRVGHGKTRLPGELSADKTTWTATERLEPGVAYHVRAVASDAHGVPTKDRMTFHSDDLTLDQQTFPSFEPLGGETVGVGMPVIIKFDVPVTDKASIERHLSVQTSPHQVGSWRWISDNEVHWRPKHYWKPGTEVTVNADVNSIPAGNGIFGQLDRTETFHVGDAIIMRVNVKTHEMKVYDNGNLLRTIPISAGKPGFITRSGIKVIVSKQPKVEMDASTVGIPKSSPEYYDLTVYWDMRVTFTGEFLHAAPWSDSAQGVANTSHGCVGMTTDNAKWLYNLTHGRGDVVIVHGSDRHMTLTNGYGDWNLSYKEWKQGSALN
jgi:lipoprotein-anchoring transpeptidase ErfK/SrfK